MFTKVWRGRSENPKALWFYGEKTPNRSHELVLKFIEMLHVSEVMRIKDNMYSGNQKFRSRKSKPLAQQMLIKSIEESVITKMYSE